MQPPPIRPPSSGSSPRGRRLTDGLRTGRGRRDALHHRCDPSSSEPRHARPGEGQNARRSNSPLRCSGVRPSDIMPPAVRDPRRARGHRARRPSLGTCCLVSARSREAPPRSPWPAASTPAPSVREPLKTTDAGLRWMDQPGVPVDTGRPRHPCQARGRPIASSVGRNPKQRWFRPTRRPGSCPSRKQSSSNVGRPALDRTRYLLRPSRGIIASPTVPSSPEAARGRPPTCSTDVVREEPAAGGGGADDRRA